jgi:hypothetical protein
MRVLDYVRRGPDAELMVEQALGVVPCGTCGGTPQDKERPVVRYVDLPSNEEAIGHIEQSRWRFNNPPATSTATGVGNRER